MTPFRNEKNTNWEGAFRVPCIRALAGPHQGRKRVERDLLGPRTGFRRCLRGRRHRREGAACSRAGSRSPADALQGPPRRLQPACPTSQGSSRSRRARSSSTATTTASSSAMRYEQLETGRSWSSARPARSQIWREPFTTHACAETVSTCACDPYERADITSNTYNDWVFERAFLAGAGAGTGRRSSLATFKEFPPRQKAGELQPRPGAWNSWRSNPAASDTVT